MRRYMLFGIVLVVIVGFFGFLMTTPGITATSLCNESAAPQYQDAVLTEQVQAPTQGERPYFDSLARKGGTPLRIQTPAACCMQTRASAMRAATTHYVHRN